MGESQSNSEASIGGDILRGADAIASFLYGDASYRRKVYNLVRTRHLPHFRLGATICARKRVLTNWIADQEQRNNLLATPEHLRR